MKALAYASLAAFLLTVPLSNWFIENVGDCSAGPCVVPVGFGILAPSGVLIIGLGLVLRDLVHRFFGSRVAFAAILVGAALSGILASPILAFASAAAFLVSETVDLLVYGRLRPLRPAMAVFASGAVGALVDSLVFLWLAFGDLSYLAGQTIGKVWMSLLAALIIRQMASAPRTA
ncbi:VUT family protein [Microvirga massiliensis]|uniref:VUT family protein n=1 Tax=Microvirga massiliensis TaxID=1033741 RepID=UPI00062BAB3D|nr:VUT family protein [Microvirga massiliensis]